jgi:uncharacterized protein YegL
VSLVSLRTRLPILNRRILRRRAADSAPAQTPEFRARWIGLASSLTVHLLLLVMLAAWTVVQVVTTPEVAIDSRLTEGPAAPVDMAPVPTEILNVQIPGDPTIESVGLPDPAELTGDGFVGLAAADGEGLPAGTNGGPPGIAALTVPDGLGGGAGSLKFFGTAETGRSFVFVVDCSGSMQGHRISRALAELKQSLDQLNDKQRFYVILFNEGAIPLFGEDARPELHRATFRIRRRAENWLKSVSAGGPTHPDAAIQMALSLKPDVMYFLTDGQMDRTARTVAQESNKHRTIIHTIGFESNAGEAILKGIATDNGGRYRFVQ